MKLIRSIHFRLIFKFLGMALMVVAGMQLISLGMALYFQEDVWKIFGLSAAFNLCAGFLLFRTRKSIRDVRLSIRDSFMIIFFMWTVVPLSGMLPFYLGTPIDSVSDALFESYAGFTTTGFTNLAKYEQLPNSIIFWKSLIQWIGGMGLMIFLIALFPLVKEGEFKVFFSDIQDTSYKPLHYKVAGTARRLWFVYLLFTLFGVGALILAGQEWFDALCFSLSTISTGGGVPYHGDLSYFALPVKIVLTILMLISGANYFYVFQIFKRQKRIKSDEFIAYLKVFLFAAFFISIAQVYKHGLHFDIVFESIFNTASFVSTTGFYSNEYFDSGILFVWMILFFLLFSGSSTGSSGGGINIYRLIILIRSVSNYVKMTIHPNTYLETKFNGVTISNKSINRVYAFFFLYILVFLMGSLTLSSLGFEFNESLGFCAASLSNTGPGVFLINGYTDLSQIHVGSKLTMIFLMIIGRIELFPFLLLISKTFWRA